MNEPTTVRTVAPSAVYQQPAPLVPVEGRRVVGYERYAGMLVPVYEAPPAPNPPPVVVRRGVDPLAQRLAATGVCAAGIGWGIGQVLSPLTAGGGGALMWLVLLLLAARYRPTSRTTTTHITTHNHGWLSHSHTTKG
jgi:hypothetical protein